MFFWVCCVGGGVTTRWVCLHGIAENMKIHSSIHVGKNPNPQNAAPIPNPCTVYFI